MKTTPRQRLRARLEDWERLLGLLRSQDAAVRQHANASMAEGLPELEADTMMVMNGEKASTRKGAYAEAILATIDELQELTREWESGGKAESAQDLARRFAVAAEDLVLALWEELRRSEQGNPFLEPTDKKRGLAGAARFVAPSRRERLTGMATGSKAH